MKAGSADFCGREPKEDTRGLSLNLGGAYCMLSSRGSGCFPTVEAVQATGLEIRTEIEKDACEMLEVLGQPPPRMIPQPEW